MIVPVGTKHVYSQQAGTRDHITIHCCINAAGQCLPPMIIFEKGYPSGAYTRGGPPNTLYAKSPNGYMDSELFLLWLKKIFLKYACADRPLLLILSRGLTRTLAKLFLLTMNCLLAKERLVTAEEYFS